MCVKWIYAGETYNRVCGGEGGGGGEDWLQKGLRELSGVPVIFYILIRILFKETHLSVKTHQAV